MREGEAAQVLEQHYFRKLDTAAADVLRKLTMPPRPVLSGKDRDIWIRFMLSLLHRSPNYLESVKMMGEQVWNETQPELASRYDQLRGADDPATVEEFLRARNPVATEQHVLLNVPRLLANPGVGEVLAKAHWRRFVVPHDERRLLLSDDPIARTNGLLIPQGHLAMPLSPNYLLVVAPDLAVIRAIENVRPRDTFALMNKWTVQSARHFVVASDLSQAAFVRKHFGADTKAGLYG